VRRPTRLGRGVAAVTIDVVLVFVVFPMLSFVPVIAGLTALFDTVSRDCGADCDGPLPAALGAWLIVVVVVQVLYWPVLHWRGKRTVGQSLSERLLGTMESGA
jgi:hypothetical protein